MNTGSHGGSSLGQGFRLSNVRQQPGLDRLRRDPIVASIVVHLLQVGTIAEAPRFRQRRDLAGGGRKLRLVQEPGQLGPALHALLEFNAIRARGTRQNGKIRRGRLLADRLRAQEHAADRLLQFPESEPGLIRLDFARLAELSFEDCAPLVARAFAHFARCNPGQLAGRFRNPRLVGRRQENVRTDKRRAIPFFRVPQGQGERPEDAARPLKSVQLRPTHIEDIGQEGMKRIAVEEALSAFFLSLRTVSSSEAIFATAVVTWGRNASLSEIEAVSKNRRRRTSATSSF